MVDPLLLLLLLLLPAAFLLLLHLRLSRCNARGASPPLPPPFLPPELRSIEGTPTELLHLPGASGAQHHVLILPGNPGSPHFYVDFALALHRASGGRLPITITCHASHSAASTGRSGSPPRFHDLASQVSHKVAVARWLLQQQCAAAAPPLPAESAGPTPPPQQRQPPRLILLGHSVGAYMCLEVMRALPEGAVAHALLLFPTLAHIGASPNGVALLPYFQLGRWALAGAALALGALPAGLQRAAARAFLPAAASPATVAAAATLIHPAVAVNALYLALTEMQEIGALDGALAARVGARCSAYFGAGDPWNRPGDHERVAEALGAGARVHLCSEGHPHGFVLHPKSAEAVAGTCWEWVRELVE
jgi:hypothetical protein